MDEAILQAYGRLTAHEFLLEVMYANWFANLPELNARQMTADLRKRSRSAYSAPDADQPSADNYGLQIMKDSEVMTGRFLQKVEKREAEIRARLAQDPFRTT